MGVHSDVAAHPAVATSEVRLRDTRWILEETGAADLFPCFPYLQKSSIFGQYQGPRGRETPPSLLEPPVANTTLPDPTDLPENIATCVALRMTMISFAVPNLYGCYRLLSRLPPPIFRCQDILKFENSWPGTATGRHCRNFETERLNLAAGFNFHGVVFRFCHRLKQCLRLFGVALAGGRNPTVELESRTREQVEWEQVCESWHFK